VYCTICEIPDFLSYFIYTFTYLFIFITFLNEVRREGALVGKGQRNVNEAEISSVNFGCLILGKRSSSGYFPTIITELLELE